MPPRNGIPRKGVDGFDPSNLWWQKIEISPKTKHREFLCNKKYSGKDSTENSHNNLESLNQIKSIITMETDSEVSINLVSVHSDPSVSDIVVFTAVATAQSPTTLLPWRFFLSKGGVNDSIRASRVLYLEYFGIHACFKSEDKFPTN